MENHDARMSTYDQDDDFVGIQAGDARQNWFGICGSQSQTPITFLISYTPAFFYNSATMGTMTIDKVWNNVNVRLKSKRGGDLVQITAN